MSVLDTNAKSLMPPDFSHCTYFNSLVCFDQWHLDIIKCCTFFPKNTRFTFDLYKNMTSITHVTARYHIYIIVVFGPSVWEFAFYSIDEEYLPCLWSLYFIALISLKCEISRKHVGLQSVHWLYFILYIVVRFWMEITRRIIFFIKCVDWQDLCWRIMLSNARLCTQSDKMFGTNHTEELYHQVSMHYGF